MLKSNVVLDGVRDVLIWVILDLSWLGNIWDVEISVLGKTPYIPPRAPHSSYLSRDKTKDLRHADQRSDQA